MNVQTLLLSFLLGGVQTFIITVATYYSSAILGALLWSFPFVLLIVVALLHNHKLKITRLLFSSALMIIITLLMLVIWAYGTRSWFKSTWEAFAVAVAVWLALCLCAYALINKIPQLKILFKK
uniref:Uncharacterized protein n=1 Tax=viral metagenome TaxID=1070528 RepID=A0A6C0BPS0_9ZZZZ